MRTLLCAGTVAGLLASQEPARDRPGPAPTGTSSIAGRVVLGATPAAPVRRAASLSGGVVDANGQPATNYNVVVFAADSARWTFPSRYVQLARPNQDGRFRLQGLPPEDYLAVALPAVQGSEWQDPDFLERHRAHAKALTLSEGEARTVDLKLTNQR